MEALLQISLEAALRAGQRIMEIYAGSDFQTQSKADDSPITIADRQANSIINSFLQPTGIPIISEENAQIDYAQRRLWSRCWIVDPLDGTKEFIKRNGEFTVNIALVEEGRPVLGVIYVPVTKELYYGDVRQGKAWKIKVEDESNVDSLLIEENEISPSNKETKDIVRVVGSSSHMNDETMTYVEGLKKEYDTVEIVSKGSSLKFCLVAE